ncbi:hypothetical protein MtrunA17_Chr3g0086771 [Medicago truncatula]|uniref:Transmembrane protein n=1 Tax=Medicago truncatula TaxID=3880 RepID=A0A396ILC4_MEDTR|nr:hypothetical protein MtrunA17_Chr3g0086771 [Medicago truncatula]
MEMVWFHLFALVLQLEAAVITVLFLLLLLLCVYHGLCPLASVFVPCFYAIFENKQDNIEPINDMS